MSKKKNNPQYVLKSDCKEIMDKIEIALWGVDGRGGIVKDIGDIKASLRLWGQLKTFGLGIASTVIAALIIAVATGAL